MKITRMDLDGAGSPDRLVLKILQAEPGLAAPIPIDALAKQLDISQISEVGSVGFEGGLITDASRSYGEILVNRLANRGRRRFCVGHELGHFLMTHHKPSADGFRCSRADMARWERPTKEGAARFEVEANEFAALMLMPPPLWRKSVGRRREPGLDHMLELAREYDVSKEAAARSYALYRDDAVAIIAVKDGTIAKLYRKATGFPTLCVSKSDPVPKASRLFREKERGGAPTDFDETLAAQWLKSDWGKRLPALYEQVLLQRDGYALIMLQAELPTDEDDDHDPDEDRTAKQRYQDRIARRQERH